MAAESRHGSGKSPHGGVHPEAERRKLLQQVLASRTFARSPRLAKFLEYICMATLEGRESDIHEQNIGVHVFGRSSSYSAVDDSIVRTQARLLRLRLEDYFEQEAPGSPLILTVPKGGYVPLFEPRPLPTAEALAGKESPPPAESASTFRPPARLWVFVAGVLLLLGVGMAGVLLYHRGEPKTATAGLWRQIFPEGKTVLIVPSDDALVLFQEFTRKPVSLNEYLNGTYLNNIASAQSSGVTLNADWFAAHQYTSSEDLKLALRLGRLPEASRTNVETRDAHAMRIEDLKKGNTILIGGSGANPWVGLFAEHLNFEVSWDWKASEGFVRNKKTVAGEAAIYRDAQSPDGIRRSYGVLAFLPGMDGNNVILLFEGTGMAGTESTADFLFSSGRFEKFARSIGATPQHVPFFEVLLETTSVAGNAPEAHVVAYRTLSPYNN